MCDRFLGDALAEGTQYRRIFTLKSGHIILTLFKEILT